MKGWRLSLCAALVIHATSVAGSEGLPTYYERYRFLAAPPSTWGDGLIGFAQPANLGLLRRPEARFHWSTPQSQVSGFEDWGLYAGVPHLGFSVQTQAQAGVSATDYAVGAGLGSEALAVGVQYGFGGGDAPRDPLLAFGAVWRPAAFVSLAGTGRFSLENDDYEWTGEAGLRPLGDERLTFFGDFAWHRDESLSLVPWSAGAAVRVIEGVDVLGRYFEGGAFTLGLTLNLGHTGAFSQSHFDGEGSFAHQSWAVRIGGLKPGLATGPLAAGRNFLALHPQGRVRYLKYRHFDSSGARFFGLLDDIRSARRDPRVAAIALNLSGVTMLPEHAWEVRTALEEAKSYGKTVVVFLDHAGMTGYHLASAGDFVVMDPHGSLLLPGYALNKTYLRGSLEKLGLKFDEWRFLKYKSAAEILVRDDMSEADREQSQAYVNDWYEQTRHDVCASRKLSEAEFDRLVDEQVVFTSDSAVARGLVDTLARWSDLELIMQRLSGRRLKGMGPDQLLSRCDVRDLWGEKPRIALVYGLGVCDMDRGIKARQLERLLLHLARDRSVKAVVFRVDSPGGDPLASDLVGQAVKKCRERKPVIVSQGQVAASGGYWLSMYADSIVAGPGTVTGSIGVIGGWLHDEGASEKLGMSSDIVQRGLHADYDAGARLPVLGKRIPRRPLTETEQVLVQHVMTDLYSRFTNAVSQSRGLELAEVNRLAEGRVYSGTDAQAAGLVDELGGLLFALDLAMVKAGLKQDQEVNIVEYPSRAGWIAWPWRTPSVLEALPSDEWEEVVRLLVGFNGQALTVLLPGAYPALDE